jgi:pimeloyl-ACP methyl ester carboxylesterase
MTIKTLKDVTFGYQEGRKAFRNDRPTLLMIHGAGGKSAIWSFQLAFLNKEINTYALDLPGHGQSGGNAAKSISGYTDWLIKVIEAWFKEPVYIMGNSMGGAIAQTLAIKNKALFEGVILIGTGATLRVAPQFLQGLADNFEDTVDTIMRYAYHKNTDKNLIKEGSRFMKEAGQSVVHDDFSACNNFDSRGDLDKISTPSLIICGEEDKLTPPDESKKLHKKIKNSALKIIPQAGHMVMIEKYEEVNELILEFIHNKI